MPVLSSGCRKVTKDRLNPVEVCLMDIVMGNLMEEYRTGDQIQVLNFILAGIKDERGK